VPSITRHAGRVMGTTVLVSLVTSCGSSQPAAAPATVVSTATTTTATPSVIDPATSQVCREFENEMTSSGIRPLMKDFTNGGSVMAIALATPIDKYTSVRGRSAIPAVSTAVDSFNSAAGTLDGQAFTLWKKEDVQALGRPTPAC
jgi:hypothetical protein